MSSDRRNRSEVIFNNLFPKENNENNRIKDLNFSKKGFIVEDIHDNIFDSIMFPDAFQKKTTDFNLDDNLSLDNRNKPNRHILRIITNKFHELYLKLVKENKGLKSELHLLKIDRVEVNEDKKNEPSTTNEKTDKANTTNNNINIGNMSLQDLNYDINKRNDSNFDENELLFRLKDEEIELFNCILGDFNLQMNELEAKDEILRREINRKIEDLTKLNAEYEEINKTKNSLINDLQNVTLRLNEYKVFLASLPNEFVKKNESVIIHSQIEEDNQYNFSIRNKDDKIGFNNFDFTSTDEMTTLLNVENKDYILMKLYEENLQYKELVAKLKSEALKCEGEISFLEKEFGDLHSLKINIMEFVKIIEIGFKEIKFKLEKFNSHYNKFKFYKEQGDFV